MSNLNVDDLFGTPSTPVYEGVNNAEVDPFLFKPNAAKMPDKQYNCVLRILPYIAKDAQGNYQAPKSILTKYVSYIKDASGNNQVICDNPESVGNRQNPIHNTFFQLWGSKSELIQTKLKSCSLSVQENYVVCQILDNKSEPNTIGQLRLFKFGKNIKKVIDGALEDQYTPSDPYRLGSGQPVVFLNLKTKSFNNSECNDTTNVKCMVSSAFDFVINPLNNNEHIKLDGSNVEGLRTWKEWYLASMPTWDKYCYVEPTKEQLDKVLANFQTYFNILNGVGTTVGAQAVQNVQGTMAQPKPQNPLESFGNMAQQGAYKQAPIAPTAQPQPTQSTASEMSYDDIMNQL